jgi:plastocyanin
VTDTNPVWVYCRQTGHCQLGMVFAINPGDKFAAFQAAAMGNTTTASSSSAASPTATGSSTPPSSTSQDHRIIVGGSTLTFEPANITAQPGDTITFEFHQKNHTVTQSSFASPCRALSSSSTSGQVGFDSGFNPASANATTFPTYTVQVNDTKPIWAYCRQVGHCADGMVFAANANESSANTFEAFQASAKGTGNDSNPTGSSSTGKNGAGAVRLGGTGVIAVGLAALFCFSL